MTLEKYLRQILPIACLFSIVLWLGNAAYIHLSVAFIQMVKALMPCLVYGVGILFQVETYSDATMQNMVVISGGVFIASCGEINFDLMGYVLLLGSLFAEAFRIVLIQITLADLKLNPMTTLYYVSPACFILLSIPFVLFELPQILSDRLLNIHTGIFFSNAVLAFALNLAVYLLIGKTSALTMNIAGVVKDSLLIYISRVTFGVPISGMQFFGYLIALAAVCWHKVVKIETSNPNKHADTSQIPCPALDRRFLIQWQSLSVLVFCALILLSMLEVSPLRSQTQAPEMQMVLSERANVERCFQVPFSIEVDVVQYLYSECKFPEANCQMSEYHSGQS